MFKIVSDMILHITFSPILQNYLLVENNAWADIFLGTGRSCLEGKSY